MTQTYRGGMAEAFILTDDQARANRLLSSEATHILLRGGARSGKTFLLVRAVVMRALKAPETRHAIFRFRLAHLKASVINDTFPKVMSLCFPGVPYRLHATDFYVDLPNKSRIVFAGLDDKDRTEKVLGTEYSTVYLNECSQISYDARNKVMTRLAQQSSLALKAYYDANPPTVASWLYRMFEARLEPKSGEPLTDPSRYATMMLNPNGNRANLATEYIKGLEELPEKDRRRFLYGEYLSAVDNALWSLDSIQRDRPVTDETRDEVVSRMRRIVVAVDPSGCSGPEDTRSDEIGIVVAGIDHNDNGHILADYTGRYSPETWAEVVLTQFDGWSADRIIAEKNYGGALVESNIRGARRTASVKLVSATRGKQIRAEPVAAQYERRRVWHHGSFPDMEDQMCQFSSAGYQGAKSPDRADAMVWALTELMLDGSTYDSSLGWV